MSDTRTSRKALNERDFKRLDGLAQSYRIAIRPILHTLEEPERYLHGGGTDIHNDRTMALLAYATHDSLDALPRLQRRFALSRFDDIRATVGTLYERNHHLSATLLRGKQSSSNYDDLEQAAKVGVFAAIQRFDIALGNQFSTYAVHYVRAHMQREYVTDLHGGMNNRFQASRVKAMEHEHDDETLMERLDIDEKKLRELRLLGKRAVSLSATHPGTEMTIEESLGVAPSDFAQTDIKKAVYHMLSMLDERERFIMEHRFGLENDNELSHDEIGRILGISHDRVGQIERKVNIKLRKLVFKLGYGSLINYSGKRLR